MKRTIKRRMKIILTKHFCLNSKEKKTLFPKLSHRESLNMLRTGHVDYLIGLERPSWHPEKTEKAAGGGDLWIYKSIFGSTIGGSHPRVSERTTKSCHLYNVNYILSEPMQVDSPLQLQFCPERITKNVKELWTWI